MIVVTGGAGFIGSNLIYGLNMLGLDEILIVDDFSCSSDKYKNLFALNFHDYEDKNDFLYQLKQGKYKDQIEIIFHQGACSNTLEKRFELMFNNNFGYSKELLNYSIREGIPFIYASSASVYGNQNSEFIEGPIYEKCTNLYSWSKLLFDQYVRKVSKDAKSQIVGLRYFNVYGPQEIHKQNMASMIYKTYGQIVQRGYVELFKGCNSIADGEQRRDFIYIQNVIDVLLYFMKNSDLSGIYNCGTGETTSFNEVANIIIEKLGKGSIKYIDQPKEIKHLYQNYTKADISFLRSVGFKSDFYSIDDGIDLYIRNLCEKNGYL